MTTPRTAPARVEPHSAPAVNQDTAWQLDFMFGNQEGWYCLGYIDGDPLLKSSRLKEEWYRWPQQRNEILRRYAQLDSRRIDTYARQCLFSRQSGAQAYALPSPIIWQDDVIDPDKPCSVLLQTSEQKYQAFLKLDRLATVEERARLAIQWHADSSKKGATSDSEHASYDPAHHVRIAGGHNSKRHGWYQVDYAIRSERVYSTDRLLARCSEETHDSSSRVSKARIAQHQADNWADLLDGQTLLNSRRWQAIIRHRPQLRQLLIDCQRVTITRKGTPDDSDSAQVAVFVQNAITASPYANVEHLPENEIRSVALVLQSYLRPNVTPHQYQVDIDCLIEDYRPKDYRPKATRCLQKTGVAKKPKVARGRAGNHADLVEQVYQMLLDDRAGAQAIVTRAELASAIGCRVRTIATILSELRAAGRISSRQLPRAGGLLVEFLGVIYSESEAPVCAVETPQIDASPPSPEETDQVSVFLPDRATDHTSITLDAAICDALDTLPRQRPNEQTGEVKVWPITDRRICDYLAENYTDRWPAWSKAAAYRISVIRRQRRNAVFAEIRDMPSKALDKAITIAERTIGCCERKAEGAGDKSIADYWHKEANKRRGRLALLTNERAARDKQEAQRLETLGYSLKEQEYFRDLVDNARQRPAQRATGQAARLVEPELAYDAAETIARLKAQRAAIDLNTEQWHQVA